MPYARNHDSAIHPIYDGPYSHDITCIFPNFDADPCNPESYDFACTDEDGMPDKKLAIDFGKKGVYEIYLLDGSRDGELIGETENIRLTIKPNTCVMIKEK